MQKQLAVTAIGRAVPARFSYATDIVAHLQSIPENRRKIAVFRWRTFPFFV
jgi:hypothetical protein